MTYEVVQSRLFPDTWVAEAIGPEGEAYIACFTGPEAEERAREYAAFKNEDKH